MHPTILILSALFAFSGPAQKPDGREAYSRRIPKGYSVPQMTRSPNGRYGVLVPSWEILGEDKDDEQNKLIDLRTGRIVGVIHAHSAPLRSNHIEIEPGNWSRDGSLFLWRVKGKWTPWALVLLKIHNGNVLWQVNVHEAATRAILTRTRRASPRRFRAAHQRTAAAYNGGGLTVPVSVNVEPGKPLSLPLKVTASLTANPKDIEGYPKSAELESELTGVITKHGKLRVTSFALTTAH